MAESLPLHTLVVEDERSIRQILATCLDGFGCRVEAVATGSAAADALRRERFDLAFCDLELGPENGLDLLPRLLGERPGLDVVIVAAYATVDTAVEAMRRGAKDYLPKPFTPAEIEHLLERARERRVLSLRNGDLDLHRGQLVEPETMPDRIGASAGDGPVLGGNFTVDEIEREHALRVMAHASTMDEAARILGIDASTLWRKRKRWGGSGATRPPSTRPAGFTVRGSTPGESRFAAPWGVRRDATHRRSSPGDAEG